MFRIGHGFDLHTLEPTTDKSGMIIAQTLIPYQMQVKAHSDGDVVYHAVIDALLGALALGDIGQWFPDNDPQYKGASSHDLLKQVMSKVQDMDYTIGNVDVTVIAERPKLKDYIPLMRETLAGSLEVNLDQISIKAKTHEKVGAIGEGRAIAAHAVIMLCKQ